MTGTHMLAVGIALGIAMAMAGGAIADDYSCVPLEVAVLDNRAHVRCAEPPPKSRIGYPRDVGYPIMYFAAPLSDPEWANRFIQMANVAMTAGRTIRFSYTSGDYSGEPFGCARIDCRTPWAFALEAVASTPTGSGHCFAELSSALALQVPFVNLNGTYHWANLQYVPGGTTADFALTNYGPVQDKNNFSQCDPSTLSETITLHIPRLAYLGVSYWADLHYELHAGGWVFTLTAWGQNP
jgi:hypothetical protein